MRFLVVFLGLAWFFGLIWLVGCVPSAVLQFVGAAALVAVGLGLTVWAVVAVMARAMAS